MYFKKFQVESTITWRNAAFCFIYEIIQNFKKIMAAVATNIQINRYVNL